MKKIPDKQRKIGDKHQSVIQMYKSGRFTTEYIAKLYELSTRQVQRLCKEAGVIRTQAEANRVAAPLKNYHHVPIEFRVKRKHLSNKQRFIIISNHPYCSVCGLRVEDSIQLEVDHIDEDATNNNPSNLQVLCNLCNKGKHHLYAFGK